MKENELPEKLTPAQRILLVASELFYKEGIHATGINKIIELSNVTKVTFYRYFPSKKDLILAYLEYRHQLWINWFNQCFERNLNTETSLPKALSKTFERWFKSDDFRGCGFINITTELGIVYPEVLQIAMSHKLTLGNEIKKRIPSKYERYIASIVLAIDGMIIHKQMGYELKETLSCFEMLLAPLLNK